MTAIQERKCKECYVKRFNSNFIVAFEEEVTNILAIKTEDNLIPSIEERRDIINTLIDAYIDQTGNIPSGNQVQRLANWFIVEDLTDPHPDKVSKEEFPILTKRQLRARHLREIPSDTIPQTHTHDDEKKLGKKRYTMNLDDI